MADNNILAISQERKESMWNSRLRQTQTALEEVKTQQKEAASERRRSTRFGTSQTAPSDAPQSDPNRTRLPQLHLPQQTQKALLEKYFARGGVTVANLSLFLNEHRLVLTEAIDLKQYAGQHYEDSTIIQPEQLLLLVEALNSKDTMEVTAPRGEIRSSEPNTGARNGPLNTPRRSQSDLTDAALQRLRKELSPRRSHNLSSKVPHHGNTSLPPTAKSGQAPTSIGGRIATATVTYQQPSRSSSTERSSMSNSCGSSEDDFLPYSQSMSATLAAINNSPTRKVETQFPRSVVLKRVLPAISDAIGAELAVSAFLETVEQFRSGQTDNKSTQQLQIQRRKPETTASPTNGKPLSFSEKDAMEALRHFLKPIGESDSKVVASAFEVLLGTTNSGGTHGGSSPLNINKEDEEEQQAKLQQYGYLLAVNDELELVPLSRERIVAVCDLHRLTPGTASALMARLDHLSIGVVHYGTFEAELLADIKSLKQLPTACLLSKGHMHVVAELVAHVYPFCIEQLLGRKGLDALLSSSAVEPYEPYTMGGFFLNNKQTEAIIPITKGPRNLFSSSTINASISSNNEDSIRLKDKRLLAAGLEEGQNAAANSISAAEALLKKYLMENANGHFSVKTKRQLYLSTLPRYMLPRIDDDEQTLQRMERVHYRRQRVLRKRDGLGSLMLPSSVTGKDSPRTDSAKKTTKKSPTPPSSAVSAYRTHSNEGTGGATLYVSRSTSLGSPTPRPISTLSTPRPCTAREWTSVIQKGKGEEREDPITATFSIQRKIPAPPAKWGIGTSASPTKQGEVMADRAHGGIIMEPTLPTPEEEIRRPQTTDEVYNARAIRLYTTEGATYPLYKKDGTIVRESDSIASRRLDTTKRHHNADDKAENPNDESVDNKSKGVDAAVEVIPRQRGTNTENSSDKRSQSSPKRRNSSPRYLPRPPQKSPKRVRPNVPAESEGFDTLVKEMLATHGIKTVV